MGWWLVVLPGIWGCANHRPELFPIYNQTVEVGSPLEFDIRAADGDGDRLNFGIVGKPDGAVFMVLGGNTASFQWTPNAADADPATGRRDYPVTFQVTDGMDMDSETIIITVLQYQSNQGRPVFISPSDYTLDLDRQHQIEFVIQVRDDNSQSVNLWLESGIPGAQFWTTPGAKTATFEWIPNAQQIEDRRVWGIRVGAKDQDHPPVYQNITILILGGQASCDGTPPKLEHQAIPEGRGSEDYPVTVSVTDLESDIQYVYLYWLIDLHDGNAGTFEVKFMDPLEGGVWQEFIPNPGLPEGQTATVSYYICAVDDDDPDGEGCDQRNCLPYEGRFEFTAYAPVVPSCETDAFEPNDQPGLAREVFAGETPGLTCCADADWYRFAGNQGDGLQVRIEFENAEGDLDLWVFDRQTVETAEVFSCENALGCSTTENDGEQVVIDSLPSSDSFYVYVFPYQGAENSYRLLIDVMP